MSTLWWLQIICLSFLVLPNITTSFEKVPSEEQRKKYFAGSELSCKDGPILVQYKSDRLEKVRHVLPWRPIIIWYCGHLFDINNVTVKGISYIKTFYYDRVNADLMPAIFIEAKDVIPGTDFRIDNKKIYIFKENQTQQIIIASNEWLNIQNKDKLSAAESGIFSMFGKDYTKYFEAYAQTIPFSQTTLLQLVPLGSVDVKNANFSTVTNKIDAQRKLSSNFVDVTYCGKRRCDGGVFKREDYKYKYANYPEPHFNRPKEYISRLLSNIKAFKLNYPNYLKVRLSRSIRTLIQQLCEYDDGVKYGGIDSTPPFGAYVTTTATTVSELNNNYIDNELPLLLGISYGLLPFSKKYELEYMVRDFQIATTNDLVYPYKNNLNYKESSMNYGDGDHSDEYFTSLGSYHKRIAEQMMLLDNPIKIDSRVTIQNHCAGNHCATNSNETLIVCIDLKNVFVYRLNALIPTVLYDEDYINKLPGQNDDMLKLTLFNNHEEQVGKIISYHVSQKMLALPQNFNEVLKNHGYLLIEVTNLKKIFFIRNDAIELDPPVQGNRIDIYKPITDDYTYALKKKEA